MWGLPGAGAPSPAAGAAPGQAVAADPQPHRCLARIYERAKKLLRKAQYHREKADELPVEINQRGEGGDSAAWFGHPP